MKQSSTHRIHKRKLPPYRRIYNFLRKQELHIRRYLSRKHIVLFWIFLDGKPLPNASLTLAAQIKEAHRKGHTIHSIQRIDIISVQEPSGQTQYLSI